MKAATKFSTDNWTYVHYKTDLYKAFISMGANPKSLEIQYFVTVTDKDNAEIFQSSHTEIEDAVQDINKRYGHWEVYDAESPPSADGCSSCSAH